MASSNVEHVFPWELGVFDAHCHPTDTMSSLDSVPGMRTRVLTVMATRAQDQGLVARAANDAGVTEVELSGLMTDGSRHRKILPAFGWHPWFSYQMFDEAEYEGAISLTVEQKMMHYQSVLVPRSEDGTFLQALAEPRPLGQFLAETRNHLQKYPLALIGEVGLDRSFRIPEAWLPGQRERRDDALTPGGREGRRLSPYRVSMDHQKKALLAQLALAGEMQRAVSVHGVQAHGILYDTLAQTWRGYERKPRSRNGRKKTRAAENGDAEPPGIELDIENTGPKPYPPRICLHSFSGPAETVKQYIAPAVPCEVFFSFSVTVNAWSDSGDGKTEAVVKAVPDNRVLVESDLHTAGESMDASLEKAVRKVCEVKNWALAAGVERLARNWKNFAHAC